MNGACMLFLLSFSFLEVEPQFRCKLNGIDGPWTYSTPENDLKVEYCDPAPDQFCEINYEDPATVKNLIVQLDYECVPGWKLGAVGALFLVGIVIGCSFVTQWGDVYGRKPVYIGGLLLNGIVILVTCISKTPWITLICMFLLGVSITARYYVGYTYNVEFQLKRDKVAVSTIFFMMESCVYLFDIIYFLYISKEWVWL